MTGEVVQQALRVSRTFLRRYRDALTRSLVDDLAQEAALEAWSRRSSLRRLDRWGAFVRTVSRRRRCRAVERHLRVCFDSLDAAAGPNERAAAELEPRLTHIAERAVPTDWCLAELPGVLQRLDPLNACIIRSYYEGFSCVELGERYGLSEQNVKVRLHRSRQRIRREFEVRAARAHGDGCEL